MLLLLLACRPEPQDTGASEADTAIEHVDGCDGAGVWRAGEEGWEPIETGAGEAAEVLVLSEDSTLMVCGGPLLLAIETDGFDLTLSGEDGILSAGGQRRVLTVSVALR